MMKSSIVGRCPPTSTLRPPDVIHVISVPRPSPFFALFRPPCIILNTNRRTKNKATFPPSWKWNGKKMHVCNFYSLGLSFSVVCWCGDSFVPRPSDPNVCCFSPVSNWGWERGIVA